MRVAQYLSLSIVSTAAAFDHESTVSMAYKEIEWHLSRGAYVNTRWNEIHWYEAIIIFFTWLILLLLLSQAVAEFVHDVRALVMLCMPRA